MNLKYPYVIISMKHTKPEMYYPIHILLPIYFLNYDHNIWEWDIDYNDAFDDKGNSMKDLLELNNTQAVYSKLIIDNNTNFNFIYFIKN